MRRRSNAYGLLLTLLLALLETSAASAIVAADDPTPPPGQTVTYTYKTFLTPTRFGGGLRGNLNEDFGTLTLTFNASKIISGTYKPDYGGFMPATGGLSGQNSFWLEFGSGKLRFTGRFTHHGIAASATSSNLTQWQLHGSFVHS